MRKENDRIQEWRLHFRVEKRVIALREQGPNRSCTLRGQRRLLRVQAERVDELDDLPLHHRIKLVQGKI